MSDKQIIYISNRYCTQHRAQAPIKGGDYITNNNGMSKRWLCAACLENRRKQNGK